MRCGLADALVTSTFETPPAARVHVKLPCGDLRGCGRLTGWPDSLIESGPNLPRYLRNMATVSP
jgi:hypothetical protein